MTRADKIYIAVDFDGTIVDNRFPKIGDPVPGAAKWLTKLRNEGAGLILWTWRSGKHLEQAFEFCREHGIEFEFVNENPEVPSRSGKAFADIYVDDSGFGCPLRSNPRRGGNPIVDWRKVGPTIMKTVIMGHRVHARTPSLASSLASLFSF